MTRENKELLLQDICARLPHGVKVHAKYIDTDTEVEKDGVLRMVDGDMVVAFVCDGTNCYNYVAIHEVKPYLFPLSSMTEEQKNQLKEIWDVDMNKALDYAISGEEGLSDLFQLSAAKKVINWFIKNHFDFQGLIPKGLAIDATNLNIY